MAIMALDPLRAEITHNVEHLRGELARIDQPDAHPPETGLSFENYGSLDDSILDEGMMELVGAFYRSLVVVIDGHPGFIDADPDQIDRSYRIIVEAAIDLGDRLIERLADHD